jgi:hypothetical protein
MRAIIIDDKDARALLDSLEMQKLKENRHLLAKEWVDIPPELVNTCHRTFHYIVCKWLQDQGCNVVR